MDWCRSTAKPGAVYLHVFDWPADGVVRLPVDMGPVSGAYLLGDAKQTPLSLTQDEGVLIIAGPAQAPDAIDG